MERYEIVKWLDKYNIADNKYLNLVVFDYPLSKKEALKVMVEEWANDNSLTVTDKQVEELVDAIGICSEMDMGSRGYSLGCKPKTENELRIEKLEKLECYIDQKGFSINYGDNWSKRIFD